MKPNPLDDVLKALETLQSSTKYPAKISYVGGAALNMLENTDIYDPHKTYLVTADKIEEVKD